MLTPYAKERRLSSFRSTQKQRYAAAAAAVHVIIFVGALTDGVRQRSCLSDIAMGTADTLFRLTTAGLGVATIVTGAWLGANMYAGFDYHRKHPQAQLGQNLQATSAEAEKA